MSQLKGSTIYLSHKFSNFECFQITYLQTVPPVALFLAKHPLVDKYNLSSLDIVTIGAAPLSKEVKDLVSKRLPDVRVVRQGIYCNH